MTPKSDFLLTGAGTTIPKGSVNRAKFTVRWVSKQVLVYGVLESTNDLKYTFVEHIHFKKPMKFRIVWAGSGTRNNVSFNHIYWQKPL